MERAEKVVENPDLLDEYRKLWIETMNHARHDWLNELQLIMGYVQMKKYDKLSACVDMLKQRLTEEGRAAKLGHPGLIELLFTYRAHPHPYRFELEVDGMIDVRACLPSGAAVESAVRIALQAFDHAAKVNELGEENILRCRFYIEQKDVVVRFTFEGAYTAAVLQHGIKEIQDLHLDFDETSVQLAFRFPFSA